MDFGERQVLVGGSPLIDAGKRNLGKILVLKDITDDEAGILSLSTSVAVYMLIIGTLLLVTFGIYLSRIQQVIVNTKQ